MMEKRHNLKCIALIKTEVILPSINLPVEIPINPLLGCIYSLLSDEKLMTSDNLIFTNPNDPSQSTPYSGNYSEINTGLAYQSFQQSVQRIDNAVPVPSIFSLMELQLIVLVIIPKHQSWWHWVSLNNAWEINQLHGETLVLLKIMWKSSIHSNKLILQPDRFKKIPEIMIVTSLTITMIGILKSDASWMIYWEFKKRKYVLNGLSW